MYYQVGQSQGEFVRMVQETYLAPPSFLSVSSDGKHRSIKDKLKHSKNGSAGGGLNPASNKGDSVSIVTRIANVCRCIGRCLRDDRIKRGNPKTVATFNRINTRTNRFKWLENVLNFIYLLIGIILFFGVILGLIHAVLGKHYLFVVE